jgi:hypothetical protein
VFSACPFCGYDLAGLGSRPGITRPECGKTLNRSPLRDLWRRRSDRAWQLVFLAPLMALPGCVLYGVGQPIISVILTTGLAYRAFARDDRMNSVPPAAITYMALAAVLGVGWSMFTTALLSALGAMAVELVRGL